MVGDCADRYGVSLTAAALRWTEIAPKRAVLVASRDDHMLWAKSNKAALKSGAYFTTRRNTIELPGDALAHSNSGWAGSQQQTARAQLWFPRRYGHRPWTIKQVFRSDWCPKTQLNLVCFPMPVQFRRRGLN